MINRIADPANFSDMLLAKRSELGETIFIFLSMKKFITMLAELAQG